MTHMLNDVTGTTIQPAAKSAWTTPSIESYDVAAFTLGSVGGNGPDGGSNRS